LDTFLLIIVVALVLFVMVAAVAFLLWRRSAQQEAAKKAAAKKKPAQTGPAKPAVPPAAKPAPAPAPPSTPRPAAAAPPKPAAPAIEPAPPPQPVFPSPTMTPVFPSSPPSSSPPPPTPPPAPVKPLTSVEVGDKIRILIVDDNPDTRENVSRLLYFENDMEVIGQAVNGRQGIEMAARLKPHIVLMDINMPDMDGITATERMTVDSPYSQVIIMSVQAEQHYMKRAMAAGARDFQPKPFTSDELVNCVRRVYGIGKPIYQKIEAVEQVQARIAAQPQVKKVEAGSGAAPVIVVYSPKGGIGTSAIAANVAVALQQAQGDVVLMDGDLQFGDISVHLNVRQTRTISDMVHEGQMDVELLPEVVLAHESGIKVLLAPPQPQWAETITPDMVTEVIKGLKKLFKAVVVDTTSKLNDVTLNILEQADYILVVTGPELPAVKSVKLFFELADQLEFPHDHLGLVINRVNAPGGVSTGQIAKVLKIDRPYLVPDDPRLYMAMYRGVAVNQQDSSAPSAQAIIRLANEVWQKVGQGQFETAPAGVVV
jgi:pilus assembly protein CpaE